MRRETVHQCVVFAFFAVVLSAPWCRAGACCEWDGTCSDNVAAADCAAAGGTYHGDGSLCSGVACLDAYGAPPAPPPCENLPGVDGNRYINADCPGGGSSEAIRIKFITLDGFPIPDPDFMYVGAPFQAPEEDITHPGKTFTAVPLRCDPYYHDWDSEGPFSVFGAEIVPSSEYQMQRADAVCPDLSDEACWSAPITLTTGKFGDIWPVWHWEMISAQPDFNDLAACVQKFLASGPATAPIKAVAQLQPNSVSPMRPVDFRDCSFVVKAFLGEKYWELFHGPCPCPASVTCGATSCTSDLQCGGGLCVNGFCADECGRCGL